MNRAKQFGFSIVSAIFILVVLAALGAFAVTVSTTQQISSAMDVQGSRAYWAARAGIEWGVYQVQASYQFGFGPSPGANPNTTLPINSRACPSATWPVSFALTAPTLSSFTVTVSCNEIAPIPLAAGGPKVFQITSTACNQPNASGNCPNETSSRGSNYVERRLEVSI